MAAKKQNMALKYKITQNPDLFFADRELILNFAHGTQEYPPQH